MTVGKDNVAVSDFPNLVRLTMMYKLPAKSGDFSDDDAPIISIQTKSHVNLDLGNFEVRKLC